mmetsp:Transcript_41688/g.62999  ORF Transcript_41688/g.62999 Transcript_41688/m.62999 type:complete len:128 (+) Transcript_41688:135-518(+)|eukprot:CAMPEP_0206487636 /NCGR_PEP_ID=MMETSP0324_2-20121206/41782_1 /ASSEMBLY_ACC=CAM_ASM_000836 /TAXON_ID=2866 /ORGANISM="Crypthecodinium cohnii, Strain Seligo" /LENGTH=127 /DNA_ID=CAMNT_0053966201 /DNA_START=204 /DNA_END=587 /DNA_ORIENTATION=+
MAARPRKVLLLLCTLFTLAYCATFVSNDALEAAQRKDSAVMRREQADSNEGSELAPSVDVSSNAESCNKKDEICLESLDCCQSEQLSLTCQTENRTVCYRTSAGEVDKCRCVKEDPSTTKPQHVSDG